MQHLTYSSQILRLSFPNGWVAVQHLSGNGDLNLNTSLDVDDDLLDDLSGGVKVDQALVDPVVGLSAKVLFHLKTKKAKPSNAVSQETTPGDRTPRFHASSLFQYNSPHLVGVPGLGALTARGLAGGDLQVLGGHADGALDAEVLGLGAVDELLADLLEGRDLAGGEGDADLVDLGHLALLDLLGIVGGHVCGSFLGGIGRSRLWFGGLVLFAMVVRGVRC